MKSQSLLLDVTQSSITTSLVISLLALFLVACTSSQPSQPSASQSSAPASTGTESVKFQHDIPPEIAIDIGSFSIETDKSLTEGVMTPTKKGKYRTGKDVLMMLIRVIRTDDGAILYQNFDAEDTEIEFTTVDSKKITIKPGTADSKKAVDFESTDNLEVQKITAINRREHKLFNNGLNIKNVIVRKGGVNLFSHDTINRPPTHPEYSDKKYRVFIRVEEK
jgi:hypothetical protein